MPNLGKPEQRNPEDFFASTMEKDFKWTDQGPSKEETTLNGLDAQESTKAAKGLWPCRWDKQPSPSAINQLERLCLL